jgi:hypothetical protein
MGVYPNDDEREQKLEPSPDDPTHDDKDPDDTPETPLDEPRPPSIQDPPAQPGPKGPYVVRAQVS